MPSTSLPPLNREAEILALRRAIAVERRARFADFQGKRTTFSNFMRQTADRLCKRYPADSRWATIRAFFRQYPNADLATRISILHRVHDLLTHVNQLTQVENPVSQVRAQPVTYGRDARASRQSQAPQVGAQSVETTANEKEVSWSKQSARKLQPTPSHYKNRGTDVNGTPPRKPSAATIAGTASVSDGNKNVPTPATYNQASKPLPVKEHSPVISSEQGGSILEIDVQFIKGVGPKLACVLANLDIHTAYDLIRHYPRRHLDFQNRLMIRDLEIGKESSIIGVIKSVGGFQSKNRKISLVTVVISDETGSVSVTRFIGGKANKYLLDRYKAQFPKGAYVLASGIVSADEFRGRLQLKNAEIEILGDEENAGEEFSSLHTGRLVPVYRLTEGLSLRHLRSIIFNALETYDHQIEDHLPGNIISKYQLMDLRQAIRTIHFPDSEEARQKAQQRLVFDELFAVQLELARLRHRIDTDESALALNQLPGDLVECFRKNLPFTLTGAQERVFAEISRDLASAKPMHRLVQGDVGSGKTVVALMSFLLAIANGYQGAMMAPTEILAEQHYRQFQQWLAPLGLRCALLLGKQGQRERRTILQDLASGQVHLAVGTHALISDGVEFKKLGLIIIDEQHRFGVKQRARLKAKGQNPELLTMTATPIPRTLALTLHGDLDVSEIDELPPGRKPVETKLFTPKEKAQLHAFIHQEIAKGRQAYIVFPLIEESESLSAKAAAAEYEKLRTTVFQDLNVGLMHGKLKPQEKDEVMEKFRGGHYNILVSTTVIEVGMDVPNATVMVIENADRFGLAQLHQLRGRVGRGGEQSYCFLVSDLRSKGTRERLDIMTQTTDGFVIAERDLQLRGPGEFLGTRQSGLPDLCLADLIRDAKILEDARNAAIELIKDDPNLLHHGRLLKQIQAHSHGDDLMGSG